jgi:hypothetical protein
MNLKAFFFPNKKKASISLQQAKEVGNKLFVDWKRVSPKTLAEATNVELEHESTLVKLGVKGDELIKAAAMIALDHLAEDIHYYLKLKKVEGK